MFNGQEALGRTLGKVGDISSAMPQAAGQLIVRVPVSERLPMPSRPVVVSFQV